MFAFKQDQDPDLKILPKQCAVQTEKGNRIFPDSESVNKMSSGFGSEFELFAQDSDSEKAGPVHLYIL